MSLEYWKPPWSSTHFTLYLPRNGFDDSCVPGVLAEGVSTVIVIGELAVLLTAVALTVVGVGPRSPLSWTVYTFLTLSAAFVVTLPFESYMTRVVSCLLYTSDAADE